MTDHTAKTRSHRAALVAMVAAMVAFVVPAAASADTLPTISGEEVTGVGVTTAKLSGQVNPNGTTGDGNTTWRFQYSPIGEGAWATAGEGTVEPPASEEANPVPVEAIFGYGGELQAGHEYEFRLVAENGAGQVETAAPYPTFTMDDSTTPVLTIGSPTNVTAHGAHVAGTVDPEGGNANPIGPEIMPIYWQLQYSADGTNWNVADGGEISGAAAQGTSPIAVEGDVSGLIPGETYQVRLHAYSSNLVGFLVEADSPGPNSSFETAGAPPAITGQDVGAFDPAGDTATIAGFVNPENSEVTDCHFVYGVGSASGNEAPCSPSPVATSERQRVGVFVTTTNRAATMTGQFKLTFEGQTTADIPANADPEVVQAELEALSTIGPGNVEVSDEETQLLILGGVPEQVEKEAAAYTVTFLGPLAGKDLPVLEWSQGATPLEGSEGEPGEVKIGVERNGNIQETVRVTATLSGLTPDAEYRYKVVATNASGTSEGPENWFRTAPVVAPEGPCANAARRVEQNTTAAECRAYEMTSPVDKNNVNVASLATNIAAAADGNAAVFHSRGGFADSIGSGWSGFNQYLTRRGADGWTTKGVSPTPALHAGLTSFSTYLFEFSPDLRKALLWGYDLPAVGDDLPNAYNFYRANTETMALEPVMPASQAIAPTSTVERINKEFGGASTDLGVATFTATKNRFDPRAEPGVPNAYEWDHGTVRLAGVLPDGTVPAVGSGAIEMSPGQGRSPSVSGDGSGVLFYSPAEGANRQLYMRRDHTQTVWVSEPEAAGAPEAEKVKLLWISPDADKVLFYASSPLVDEGPGTDHGGLYLYTDGPDPASESNNLTLVTKDDYLAEGGLDSTSYEVGGVSVAAATDDARRIYFLARFAGGVQLVFWEDGEIRKLDEIPQSGPGREESHSYASPGDIRASADGSVLAFFSESSAANTRRLKVYDATRNTKSCVSCGRTVKGSRTATVVPNGETGLAVAGGRLRPRYLSSDGRRLFFSTSEAFVPEDTNGVFDVYAYDTLTAERKLVSSGKGEHDAWFANASLSGDNVFFTTRSQLVGKDPDRLTDLYDARVGGGFAEPPPPPTPCSGDNCRGPLSPPLGGSSPATSSFSGPGNPKAKPHGKKQRGKHKAKKNKKKKNRQQNRAGNHKRAGAHR